MSSLCESIHNAVAERDIPTIHSLFAKSEFILLSSSRDEEDQHDGAFVAEIEEMQMLLVFTENAKAHQFVDKAGHSISANEEVDGIYIEGLALIDYLPSEFGILLDAECNNALIIERELMQTVKQFTTENQDENKDN